MKFNNLNVCLVHDWLVTYRGGEKVLMQLAELFPSAPIYTLFHDKDKMPPLVNDRKILAPTMSKGLRPFRKMILPLLPHLIESFDLSSFDLIISSSSCVAKGIIKPPKAKHLCYIHSPMRYVWDQMEEYIQGVKNIPGAEILIRHWAPKMRSWDVASADRVDHFVANSEFVKARVLNYYSRTASVIHPPIDINKYYQSSQTIQKGGYFLAAGALVSYKRFDLAIEACKRLKKKLIVAGSGPMLSHLQKSAGPTVQFVIQPHDDDFRRLLAGADALLFPGVEDFGMVAIEAMASGTPVIAYKGGGALDFIEEGTSGVFFDHQTPESLARCIERFSSKDFSPKKLFQFSKKFDSDSFKTKICLEIESLF